MKRSDLGVVSTGRLPELTMKRTKHRMNVEGISKGLSDFLMTRL